MLGVARLSQYFHPSSTGDVKSGEVTSVSSASAYYQPRVSGDFITGRLVLKKTVFSVFSPASKLNTGLINKGWYDMFFARGIWCVADVSNVSPSSEKRFVSVITHPLIWRQ